MDDQAHIRLVHAHTEGVGGDDHAQLATNESVLDVLLLVWLQSSVKMPAGPVLPDEEIGQLFRLLAAGDEHHGTALTPLEFVAEQVVGARKLLAGRYRKDLEMQVRALGRADEGLEANAQLIEEMLADIVQHILLGGGGEAPDRGELTLAGELMDETRRVKVVRSEIVAPLRQAVRLIEDPGTDLPIGDRFAKSVVSELLGRHQQHAHIAQLDLLQHVGPLGHGQQAVQCGRTLDVAREQAVHLIFHQRLQRRDDHCEAAVAVIAIQRRQLIADRLAATGGKHGQHRLASHAGQDDVVLHAAAFRLVAKIVEAKVALEFPPGVVRRAAVGAAGVVARPIAQLGDQLPHRRELVADPRGEHRITTRHPQPCQHVGDRPMQFGPSQIVL